MAYEVTRITKATAQLRKLVEIYGRFFPLWTFPYLPFLGAAFFQVFAWTSGSTFLKDFTLIPRIIILWFMAGGEYILQSPTMNAGVEVRHMSEPKLVVIYQVMTMIVFLVVNTLFYKNPFRLKYVISFALLAGAVYTAFL